MARIRSLKPEFWSHPKTAKVSRDARLLFVGLLTESDDEGRSYAAPRKIAGALYPHDENVTAKHIGRWLKELQEAGLIELYTIDGTAYISVIGFKKHQKVSHPTPSRLPPPPRNLSGAAPESLPKDSSLIKEGIKELGSRRGDGLAVASAPEGGEVVQSSAHRIAADLWENTRPRPSIKFIALRKLVERFIEAGWPEAAVADALRRTKVFTLAGIEFTLRTHHKQAEPQAWEAIRAAMEEPA